MDGNTLLKLVVIVVLIIAIVIYAVFAGHIEIIAIGLGILLGMLCLAFLRAITLPV